MEPAQEYIQQQAQPKEAKLSANETIALLTQAINSDNKTEFYQTIGRFQRGLIQTSPFNHRLLRLINQKPRILQLQELPFEIKKLIIKDAPAIECVYLNEKSQTFVDTLLLEWENKDLFLHHNLGVRNKILLHGPTGNGKTTLARHIAEKLKLPFIEVNADNMIDSHVGSTGGNINKLFSQLQMPCILFWDEVDSIGRMRGKGSDSAASMENERMVNSILVNLDRLAANVLFIGATNRMDVLDAAFKRRFDVQFELGHPDEIQKQAFAKQVLAYYKLPLSAYQTTNFKSLAEIKIDLADRARHFILSKIKQGT